MLKTLINLIITMSFSQFIKIKNIIENYRQTDEQKEDLSLHNNQESINSSMYRPKSTKVQKLFTNKLFRKNERFKNINKIGFGENLININNSNNYNELYKNITLILKNIINNNKENEKNFKNFFNLDYLKSFFVHEFEKDYEMNEDRNIIKVINFIFNYELYNIYKSNKNKILYLKYLLN